MSRLPNLVRGLLAGALIGVAPPGPTRGDDAFRNKKTKT